MKKLNATKSAEFLGVTRQYFYKLREKHALQIVCVEGIVSYYDVKDLKKIRKTLRG